MDKYTVVEIFKRDFFDIFLICNSSKSHFQNDITRPILSIFRKTGAHSIYQSHLEKNMPKVDLENLT